MRALSPIVAVVFCSCSASVTPPSAADGGSPLDAATIVRDLSALDARGAAPDMLPLMGGSGLDFTPGRLCTLESIANAKHVNGGDLAAAIAGMANNTMLVVDAGQYQGPLAIDNKQGVTICAAPEARPVVSSSVN